MKTNLLDSSRTSKKCRQVQIQFTLLLGNELHRIAAWLLWHHIDHCSHCREELATMRRLDRELRQADIVPKELRVPLEESPEQPSATSSGRKVSWGWAAALPAVLVTAWGVWWIKPKHTDNQAATLAQIQAVEQTLRQTRNAHWIETRKDYNIGTGQLVEESTQEWWVQLTPAAERVRPLSHLGGRSGKKIASYSMDEWLQTAERRARYHEADKSLQVSTIWQKQNGANSETVLRERIVERIGFPYFARETTIKNRPGQMNFVWSAENIVWEGEKITRFVCRTATRNQDEPKSDNWNVRVWVRASDYLPVRYETTITDSMGRKIRETIRDHVQFDEPIEKKFFASLAPPRTPVFHDEEISPVSSRMGLTLEEQRAASSVISSSQSSLNVAYWESLPQVWDFGYVASLPKSPIASGALEKQLRQSMETRKDALGLRRFRK